MNYRGLTCLRENTFAIIEAPNNFLSGSFSEAVAYSLSCIKYIERIKFARGTENKKKKAKRI